MEDQDELGIMPPDENEEEIEQVEVDPQERKDLTVTLTKKEKGMSRRATEPEKKQWFELKKEGWSYSRISEHTGYTEDTIKRWVKPQLDAAGLDAYGRARLPGMQQPQQSYAQQPMQQAPPEPEPEPEPPSIEEVKEQRIKELKSEIIDFDLLPEDTQDMLVRLEDVLKDYQVNSKQIPRLLKTIGHSNSYQTFDGMFNFLAEWPGIGFRKAKLIVEYLFQWTQTENARKNQYQANYPQTPGHPQYPSPARPPNYPQNPGYPPQQQQPGYPPQPYYPPPIPQPQGLTKEDVSEMLKSRDNDWQAKWEKREAEYKAEQKERQHREEQKELKKQMQLLQQQIANPPKQSTDNTIIRRIALIDEKGNPILDPNTKQPMYNEEIVPISQVDPNAPMVETMQQILASLSNRDDPNTDKLMTLEREKLVAQLDAKAKEIQAQSALASEQLKNSLEMAKLENEKERAKNSKLPADAQIVTTSIEKQSEMGLQILSNMNNNVKELVGLGKVVLTGGQPNEQQNSPKPQQWSPEEIAAMNKEIKE